MLKNILYLSITLLLAIPQLVAAADVVTVVAGNDNLVASNLIDITKVKYLDNSFAYKYLNAKGKASFTFSNFDLSSVPSEAIIQSIAFTVVQKAKDNNRIYYNNAKLTINNVDFDFIVNSAWTKNWETNVFGGDDYWDNYDLMTSEDLNGLTATINVVNKKKKSSSLAYIDYVSLTVSYTMPTVPTMFPVASCKDVIVYLDQNGTATIGSSDVDNGSSDNIGIATMTLSQYTFSCEDIGGNNELVIPTNNGSDVVLSFDAEVIPAKTTDCRWGYNFNVLVNYNIDIPGNAGSIYTLQGNIIWEDGSSFFSLPNSGGTGSVLSSNAWRGISDCATVTLDDIGFVGFELIINGSDIPATTTIIKNNPAPADIELTVTNYSGNSSSCTANLTVLDTLPPTVICQDITVALDNNGTATIVATDIDNGSADNCGIETMSVSPSTFSCDNVGANTVTLTVVDVHGNSATSEAKVTVSNSVLCHEEVETKYVNYISNTNAMLHAYVMAGANIVEYGFYYSTNANKGNLTEGVASKHQSYNGTAQNFLDLDFTGDITIDSKQAYYFRAFMKNSANEYSYGKLVRFAAESRDYSLHLDGDNDGLMVDSTATKSIIRQGSNGEFAVDFWLKCTDYFFPNILNFSDADYTVSDPVYRLFYTPTGQVVISKLNTPILVGRTNTTDNDWHHVAMSYDGTTLSLFIDGEHDGQVNLSPFDFTAVEHLIIGLKTSDATFNFTGQMDALRFWSTDLTVDQVALLASDNISESTTGNVQLVGSEQEITDLAWSSLNASFGFNMKSNKEAAVSNLPTSYKTQDDCHLYPFFHEDSHLNTESYPNDAVAYSYNVIAIGDATLSVDVPRVSWRKNATNNDWLNSNNWSGFAYPGQGATSSDCPVFTSTIDDDAAHCKYTIIGQSDNSPVVTTTPPAVRILVDSEVDCGTYRVDDTNNSSLSILNAVTDSMFHIKAQGASGTLMLIEAGSFEIEK